MRPTIETASGAEFDFSAPSPSKIHIEDIAHALSHLCRFTGHTRQYYSVAQHSYIVSTLVPREHAMQGLLHDATEAYVGDVSSPLKTLLPDYREIEGRVWMAICIRFGIDDHMHESVKAADRTALVTEKRDLMPAGFDLWQDFKDVAPRERPITPLPPQLARNLFLNRYHELRARP